MGATPRSPSHRSRHPEALRAADRSHSRNSPRASPRATAGRLAPHGPGAPARTCRSSHRRPSRHSRRTRMRSPAPGRPQAHLPAPPRAGGCPWWDPGARARHLDPGCGSRAEARPRRAVLRSRMAPPRPRRCSDPPRRPPQTAVWVPDRTSRSSRCRPFRHIRRTRKDSRRSCCRPYPSTRFQGIRRLRPALMGGIGLRPHGGIGGTWHRAWQSAARFRRSLVAHGPRPSDPCPSGTPGRVRRITGQRCNTAGPSQRRRGVAQLLQEGLDRRLRGQEVARDGQRPHRPRC
jgi:hypothetical protein